MAVDLLPDTALDVVAGQCADATVTAKGPIDALAVHLDAAVDSADYGRANLSTALEYTPEAVRIDRLRLTSPDMPGELGAEGRIALSEGNAMDVTLDWSQLQWPARNRRQSVASFSLAFQKFS